MKGFGGTRFPQHFTTLAMMAVASAAGCDRAPSDSNAREWTAADHDRTEERGRLRAGMQASANPRAAAGDGGASPSRASGPGGDDAVVELTWQNQCASCHGMTGHGDGPNGPMVRAPDLTRADWQAKATDAEIAGIIRTGKNKMPRFDLSEKVISGLIARIRAGRGR